MTGLLKPFGNTLGSPGVKPVGRVNLDWRNPLTNGLFDCLAFTEGGGAPRNLAVPAPVTLSGGPTWKPTARGIAGAVTGGSSFNIADHGNMVAGAFTIRLLFQPVAYSGNFATLLDKGNGGGRELSIFLDTSGNIDFLVIGGVGPGLFTTGFATGKIWDFVLSVNPLVGCTAYVNGIFLSATGTAGTTATNTPLALGGNPSGGGVTGTFNYHLFQSWKRELSASDVKQLYLDPWGMFSPDEGEMPALLFVAPPASVYVAQPAFSFLGMA